MSDKTLWLQEIIYSLEELGGKATLFDIYNMVEKRKQIGLSKYIDWKSRIRINIYLHSSDTDIFEGSVGDNKDLFYTVAGKGSGVWGLREYKSTDN